MALTLPKFQQDGTGAVNRDVGDKLKEFVSVKDFGAVGDGVTDDTAAIQAALDSVPNGANSYAPSKLSGGAGRVSILFPPGNYRVTAPLDMSQRDYTRLVADGRVTIFSSSTTYIIDMASADHCEIDGLALYSTTARVGIYINRCTTNPFAMFNTIRNVVITLTPDVTANSGNGRIGIYNNRGEQNIFENLVLRCDVPYWAQNIFDASFPPTSGTQDTAIQSATVNTHIQCNFIANGTHNVGVVLKNVIGFEFINCYWGQDTQTAGSLDYAVYAENSSRCLFTGSIEVFRRFMLVVGSLYAVYTDIVMQVDRLDAGGVFNLDTAGNNGVLDSQIKVLVAGGTPAAGACIFKDSGTATAIQIIGNLIETTGLMIPITTVGGRSISKNIIKTDGGLSLSNAVLSDFGSTTAPSGTMTSKVLSDYEEGTWTPSIGGTATYNADNVGSYTRVGRLVTLHGRISVLVAGTGSSFEVFGIPYTAAANNVSAGSVGNFSGLAASVVMISPVIGASSNKINLFSLTAAAGTHAINSLLAGGSKLEFTISYLI